VREADRREGGACEWAAPAREAVRQRTAHGRPLGCRPKGGGRPADGVAGVAQGRTAHRREDNDWGAGRKCNYFRILRIKVQIKNPSRSRCYRWYHRSIEPVCCYPERTLCTPQLCLLAVAYNLYATGRSVSVAFYWWRTEIRHECLNSVCHG
jgi:hypothetical protein